MHDETYEAERALARAAAGLPLSLDDARALLAAPPEADADIFTAARAVRAVRFGDTVFLYGFVYFSTYCRNDCAFCRDRRSNTGVRRIRKDPGEALAVADSLAASGVHLIDLTMGEDEAYLAGEAEAPLVRLTRDVRAATGLPIMVSPGVVPDTTLSALREAGADWYACYQETHTRGLFATLRPGQDFDTRMDAKRRAARLGMLTEEGILTGVGETWEDVAQSLFAMRDLCASQVRVMSFVPQEGTPLAALATPPRDRELRIIAVMRLMFPDVLIPASLDVDGLPGLRARLDAGANVVTSLIPPGSGLGGVAREHLGVEEGERTVSGVKPVLAEAGLRMATVSEYAAWVARARERGRAGPCA